MLQSIHYQIDFLVGTSERANRGEKERKSNVA